MLPDGAPDSSFHATFFAAREAYMRGVGARSFLWLGKRYSIGRITADPMRDAVESFSVKGAGNGRDKNG